MGQKSETPARGRALPAKFKSFALSIGTVPRDPRDIASIDADIGKLAVAEVGKLAQTEVVTLPHLDEANDGK
jgi:hypothetical protein